MKFGVWTRGWPKEPCIRWGLDYPQRKGQFWGDVSQHIVMCREYPAYSRSAQLYLVGGSSDATFAFSTVATCSCGCVCVVGSQQKADTKRSKFSLESDSSSDDDDKKDAKSDSSLSDDETNDIASDDNSDGWDDSDSDRNPFAKGSDSDDDGTCQDIRCAVNVFLLFSSHNLSKL